jgi:hypothetical protein
LKEYFLDEFSIFLPAYFAFSQAFIINSIRLEEKDKAIFGKLG